MITRPLDLASRLRRPPRSFDVLFYVNVGLIVVFFILFGSRFVLAPGLGLEFRMPTMEGARAGAAATTHVISVPRSGLYFADGAMNAAQLRQWLEAQAKTVKQPVLLIRAAATVPLSDLTEVSALAHEAGFVKVIVGAQEAGGPENGGQRK
ncbi:biopolymer transporter ExbD [Horticoccus luteus]|uniref:Biopolymer transporter ExbD n=1 Tax=Horticoccus luteus TaxID=2862869 RepID=A0A8F9XKI1_9BACT|nr:biopolymer transporter ExbD [Horticoccus luteus]QYM79718.1 biopolymer transporter ExbD [Horticoccus luteus]